MHTMLQNEPVLTLTRIPLPLGERQTSTTHMGLTPLDTHGGRLGDSRHKDPIRVAFLTRSLPEGETEAVIWNLMKRMNSIRFASQLFCLGELGALGQDIAHSVPVTAHLVRRRRDAAVMVRFAKHLRGRVDVLVVVGGGTPLFWSRISARLAKVPVVVNALPYRESLASVGRWNRLLTPWTDAYIAGSEAQRKLLVAQNGLPKQKVHFVPNGVDTQQFMFDAQAPFTVRAQLGIPAGTPLCGIVGPLRRRATWELALATMEQVLDRLPAVHFLLTADERHDAERQRQAQALRFADRIHWVDQNQPRARLLAALNVYCDLTPGDVISDRMLEALSVQVPVVALLGSGNATVLHAGESGLLAPSDDLQQLAEAITQLVNDAALSRRLGAEGRQSVVKHWSLERMVRAYEHLLCELFRRKSSGPGNGLAADDRHSVEFCGASP